jgi:hypothetical protein
MNQVIQFIKKTTNTGTINNKKPIQRQISKKEKFHKTWR